jgi:hypothetical protein
MRGALLSYASTVTLLAGCGGIASHAGSVSGTDGPSGGGASGSGCQDLQLQAQHAADTSCGVDADCDRPPHTAGDCTECGVVLNSAHEQSSLMAVQSVCQQFDAQGCQIARHSCFAQRPYCDAGVCALASP